jgi:hypothetical protein
MSQPVKWRVCTDSRGTGIDFDTSARHADRAGPMKGAQDSRRFALALLAASLWCASAYGLDSQPLKIGVGSQGPISPQAMSQIEQVVGEVPGVKVVPIVPPGDLPACVRRFVAGAPDDRLDGLIVVRLPADSFKVGRDSHEAAFTGSYEIYAVDFSTLAEDRHQFTFADSEPVTGGMSAIIALPADLLAERTTGTRLISGNAWQAFQTVQARIEAKLTAATRLYLTTAPIRNLRPLDRLQCGRRLLDAGEVDTAMAVFKDIGLDNPQVSSIVAGARRQMTRTRAENLLGRTLGAIAGGDVPAAGQILAQYEKEPAAEPALAQPLQRAIAVWQDRPPNGDQLFRTDVPGLNRASFIAMVKQVFSEQTGTQPEVETGSSSVAITDKAAESGIKTRLDGFAIALGKCAWLMSLKCGCEATATLTADRGGAILLQARFGASSSRPQVGLP